MYELEFDNIMALAKKANYKKIVIMRISWATGSKCIVDKVVLKPDGKYGFAYGHIYYRDGNEIHGEIKCAGNYSWRTIEILDEDMEVEQL